MTRSLSEAERYLREHAIDRGIAERLGIQIDGARIRYPGGRTRVLDDSTGAKIVQPKGVPLEVWWPTGRPAPGAQVLLCEGESDALAAVSALAKAPAPTGLRDLPVACVPGTGFPVDRLVLELRTTQAREVWLGFDADEAGRGYAHRVRAALTDAGVAVGLLELPDGADLAATLAAQAQEARGEWLAALLADAEVEQVSRRPCVMSARALCELDEGEAADELLGPLLVRGARTVIGAHTGEGKSTFALQALGAMVGGGVMLGWRGTGGRALVIDAEQGLRTIKRRLREAGLESCDAIDFLRAPDGLRLDQDEQDVADVEGVLRDGGYDVVVADPLYKLHAGDSNEERHAVDLMRRLDGWRSEFGFSLLLLSHRRKAQMGSRSFTLDDFFGSSAYLRGAEVVLGLHRVRPGYSRLHFFKDRDGDLPVGEAWGLLFDRESGYRRDPEDSKPATSTADQVAELLAADPGMTMEVLKAATERSERAIRGALSKIGAVGTGYPKRYRLPAGDQREST